MKRKLHDDNEAITSDDSDDEERRLFEKFLNRRKIHKSRKKQTNSLIKEARQLLDEIQHEESSSRKKIWQWKKSQRKRPSKEEQLDQKILCSLIGHQRKRKTKTP